MSDNEDRFLRAAHYLRLAGQEIDAVVDEVTDECNDPDLTGTLLYDRLAEYEYRGISCSLEELAAELRDLAQFLDDCEEKEA